LEGLAIVSDGPRMLRVPRLRALKKKGEFECCAGKFNKNSKTDAALCEMVKRKTERRQTNIEKYSELKE